MKNISIQKVHFLGDIIIIVASFFLSLLLRYNGDIPEKYINDSFLVAVGMIGCYMYFFYRAGSYKRLWSYASIGELYSIFKATMFALLSFIIFTNVMDRSSLELSIPIISWLLIVLGVGGSRLLVRLNNDAYVKQKDRLNDNNQRALIIGAGSAGRNVAQQLKNAKDEGVYPVAFIDDDRNKHTLKLCGLSVYGGRESIVEAVEKFNISLIIIAMPSASRKLIKEIIEICNKTTCKVKVLPSIRDVIQEKIKISNMRDVHLEDLLGREMVQTDIKSIEKYVANKTVLITGAGGSIGSELSRQISQFYPKKILLLGHGENSIHSILLKLSYEFPQNEYIPVIADIQDKDNIDSIFEKYRPDAVFHTAAHKHVPLMEENPKEAIKNNVFGTLNLVEASDRFGINRFIMISSDKAVNPTSTMGMTKRIAEIIVQNYNHKSDTKFAAVRFGNVLGSRGSVVHVFKEQIKKGGPVTVTHPEMVRFFMTIPEAVQLVIQAGALTEGGEIFVLNMGEPVKVEKLARDLIKLSGFQPDEDIEIVFSGIRPGEKLYEELFTENEGHTVTQHDRIFVSDSKDVLLKTGIDNTLDELMIIIESDLCNKEIKATLQQIVEENESVKSCKKSTV
ncbi:nucleoside-diphosphate sugar epimerase/dehydratase [Bacillus tianshenii]|nr:nucleoside-diphosphate sugar epimerase/dehydratase [Bacillus tianshenii]